MRRAIFVPATGLILFILIMAPFSHIHYRTEGGRALQDIENHGAVVHAHFIEEPDDSNGYREDLDHSPDNLKPLISSALRSSIWPLERPRGEAAALVSIWPPPVVLQDAQLPDIFSIHDPPGLRLQTLRSPPAENPL